MLEDPAPQPAQAASSEVQPQYLLHYHHTEQCTSQLSHTQFPATPEQLHQYQLFMSGQPHPQPRTPSSSFLSDPDTDDEPVSAPTMAVVESIIAILGMVMMLVVGIIGFQQMQTSARNREVPDMSGVLVAMACIPIAVAFFMLLIRLAVRRERMKKRDGQIALPEDDIEMGGQRQRTGRGLMARFWSGGQSLRLGEGEEDAPPSYEEVATQTGP